MSLMLCRVPRATLQIQCFKETSDTAMGQQNTTKNRRGNEKRINLIVPSYLMKF